MNGDSPLISIIVPVYNVEPYVGQCVRSLREQTYKNIEVIMVDDGSTDNSYEVCRAAIDGDERFNLLRNPVCKGVSAARNIGLEQAKGDLLGFVDPDDWIEADLYESLYGMYRASGADIVQCGYCYHLKDGRVEMNTAKRDEIFDRHTALELLFQDRLIKSYVWNKLYRRSLFDGIAFPEGRTFEDILTLPKVFERANSVCVIADVKYHYVEHARGIVFQAFRKNRWDDYLYALNKKYEYAKQWGVWKDSDRFLANMYLRILDRHLVYSNSTTSQQDLLKSLDENINGLHLLRLSPYLAMRRFLCLHGFVFYRCLTKLCFKLKRHNN